MWTAQLAPTDEEPLPELPQRQYSDKQGDRALAGCHQQAARRQAKGYQSGIAGQGHAVDQGAAPEQQHGARQRGRRVDSTEVAVAHPQIRANLATEQADEIGLTQAGAEGHREAE